MSQYIDLKSGKRVAQMPRKYNDGRTKQAFKKETDINRLLARAQKAGTLSHLQKHGAFYADFADFDFDDAHFAMARAKSIFEELPSEIRKEFNQSPKEFFTFVNDPANVNDLARVLPGLAAPGRQVVAGKPGSVRPPASEPAQPGASSEASPEADPGLPGADTTPDPDPASEAAPAAS